MPELIERKKALKNICKYCSEPKCKEKECMVFAGIKDTPTAEPEVRHGRWIELPESWQADYECSECGAGIGTIKPPYCAYCGARMDATDTNVGGKGGADNG